MTENRSIEAMISDARRIAVVAGERRFVTHARRDVEPEVIAALREADLFRLLQPKAFGGHEADLRAVYAVQNALAETCMSTAWVYGVLTVQSWFVAQFGGQAQADIWADDPTALICSSGVPRGAVRAVDGGYRLTGVWPYSSGSTHAQWAVICSLLPSAAPGGPPTMMEFVVPRRDYEIVDVWHTFGLQGTGSNDLRLDEVFVPEHRSWKADDGALGNQREDLAPVYRLPWYFAVSSIISNLCIGGGRGAVTAFLGSRGRSLSPASEEAEDRAVADAHLEIESAEALLGQDVEAMMGYARRRETAPAAALALYRRRQHGMLRAVTAKVETLMLMTGARGIADDGPLTRVWLDLCAARHHAGNSPAASSLVLAKELKAGRAPSVTS